MQRTQKLVNAVLGLVCRFTGCITALLLLHVELQHGLASLPAMAVLQGITAGILAVLIGNVVKECSFDLSQHLMTALGYPFVRKSMKFIGRVMSEIEIWFPDGTWIRIETRHRSGALEWTDLDGSCTRVEVPAMTVTRATPWRTLHSAGGA